jgi:3-oxoacyl-[acyl-carrier-protein] synthase III
MAEISIIGVHAVVPPSQPFAGTQAIETGYAFMQNEGALDTFPYSTRRVDSSQLAVHRCDQTQIPIAAAGTSSADLAVRAARELLEKHPDVPREHISLIIHAHSTLSETISGSVSGRIQHELGLRNALPFGVSQQHACGFFAACDLAMALSHTGESNGLVLLVCSDKWLFPFFRAHGPSAVYGDAGAAALLQPDNNAYARIAAVSYRSEPELNAAYSGSAIHFDARYIESAAAVIAAVIAAAGLSPSDIGSLIEPTYPPSFLRSVSELAGLQHARYSPRSERNGHLSAADGLVNLQAAMASDLCQADYSLLWQAGMAGDFGACVIRNRPPQVAREPQ